ncbi:hypothetical protein ACHABX_06500 [Nesterenkonia halotolerans]|uniref:hypothetical protein n=1 Tax=Nesterenkonia halotolerans TaxID=225325 RepID=UPI003EE44D2B
MKPSVIKLRTWSRSRLDGLFTEAEISALERYSSGPRRNEEMVSIAHRCMAHDPRPLLHPLTGAPAACYASVSHDNIYNLLAFSDGSEPVFVIQRVSFMDGIYFPERNIFLSFRLQDVHIEKLFDQVDFSNIDLSEPRDFSGFIISHHRPYHFFYDVMPAMADVDTTWNGTEKDKNAVELVQLQGGDYLPVNVLYPAYLCYTASSSYLNHRTKLRRKYYFKVGYFGLKGDVQEASINRFDRSILESRFTHERVRLPDEKVRPLTLSFDISNEKGTWRSMPQDVPQIVRLVSKQLDSEIHVVFDGWTLPHTPSMRDLRRVREERSLAGSIRRRLQGIAAGVDSLVGASPRDKIERLYEVDAFVARYGTGSMFVSRMLRRPGVAHHSGLANYEDIHLQGPRVTVLRGRPTEHEEDSKAHFVPYDMDWESVANELVAILR